MTNLEDLPNWRVEMNEVSAGVYRVTAVHTLGPQIEVTGTDDRLLNQPTGCCHNLSFFRQRMI